VATILIYSNNPNLASHCTHALIGENKISMLSSIQPEINADAVLFDAKKLDDDPGLLATFASHSCRFLVMGMNWPEEKQIEAMVFGAAGYCEQSETAENIKRAVDSILKGDIWIRRSLVPKVIRSLSEHRRANSNKYAPIDISGLLKQFDTLSEREIEVADLIQLGESNKRIATYLNISERTVKAHLSSIFRKLAVDDRLQLAILLKELEQHRKVTS
jgi:two-component system, NarL family, nitrate/nitrite response regulator NarL